MMGPNTNHTTSTTSTPLSLGRQARAIASVFLEDTRTFQLMAVKQMLSSATYVASMAAPPPESPSAAVEPARARLAQAQGAGSRRAQERRVPAARFPGPLRTIPVARSGGRKGPGRGDPSQGRPRGEHETARGRAALPRSSRHRLCGPDGSLPEAGNDQGAPRGRGTGAAGARDGPPGRHRLLRRSRTPAGAACPGDGGTAFDSTAPGGSDTRRAAGCAEPPGPEVGHSPAASRGPHRLRLAHQALSRPGGRVPL